MFRKALELVVSHGASALATFALVLLVVITAGLAHPRQRATTIEYPAPLGARIITAMLMGLWILLIFAPLDLGMYWLAALFAPGPLYTLWRWPETISIDELRIHQSAWCHRDVSILWAEVESIKLGGHGDSLVLRGRSGERIEVSSLQVGSEELLEEITRRTGLECPPWHTVA
jgi:hypothetical protein